MKGWCCDPFAENFQWRELSSSRSALDVMRLVELLMVLIVEGRKALPKTPHPALMAKRMESVAGDRSHRQMIEAIRAGNNEEFYECMDAGWWPLCLPSLLPLSLAFVRSCHIYFFILPRLEISKAASTFPFPFLWV